MFKIFGPNEPKWGGKVNFVDDKNNLVGFDTDDDCCAHGGWFISEQRITKELQSHDQEPPQEYPDYSFDVDFFEEPKSEDTEDGSLVIFKMIAPNKPDLYLHLYNCHNGYYAKGFNVDFGGKKREGNL